MRSTPFNIRFLLSVPALLLQFTLISCSGGGNGTPSIADAPASGRQWYRQAVVDLGNRIRMFSVEDGLAISRGMGNDVRGKAFRFRGGQWVPFLDYEYSDYPLIARKDSSTVWTINHLTHDGAYRPILTEINSTGKHPIPLPTVMWDDVDHVMYKGIHRFPDGTAWLVGQQGHILYYNGVRWTEVPSPLINRRRTTVYEGDLNDIAMTSTKTGWAVGRNGVIIRYDGSAWKKVPTPTTQTLQRIAMLNDSTGFAVGNSGMLLSCRNAVWSVVPLDVREQLTGITILNRDQAWAVGANGVLLAFDGTSWNRDRSISAYDDSFNDISAVMDSTGTPQLWIIGNEGIYTTFRSIGVSFTDITEAAGLRRIGRYGHFIARSSEQLPDLLMANDGGASLLFENNGDDRFTDVTSATELIRAPKDAALIAVGDVNNDGYQDVFQSADHRTFQFLLGTADGAFRDFTDASGLQFDEFNLLFPLAARFIDLDNDGNLDLYISNNDLPDQCFAGDGTGRFRRVQLKGAEKELHHASYGAVFLDADRDGRTDILIPYYVSSGDRFFSLLYNRGAFTFEASDQPVFHASYDVSPTAIVAGDFNNDLWPDLYIHSQKVAPMLWRNDGHGRFRDASKESGFTEYAGQLEPFNGVVAAADVNNDGLLDIYAGSKLYLNSPEGRFTEVAERVGIQFVGTPAFADIDGDGDQDLFIGSSRTALGKGDRAALFRNNRNDGRSIAVRVSGDHGNRGAIGATVELVSATGSKQVRIVGGLGSQLTTPNTQEVHFGTGTDSSFTVTVRFSSGAVRSIAHVEPGISVEVTESSFFTHDGVLFVRSVERMVHLLTIGRMLVLFAVFVSVLGGMLFTSRTMNAERFFRLKYALPALAIIFFVLMHRTMYAPAAVAAAVAGGGSIIAAAAGLYLTRSIVERREARYIGRYRVLELLGSGGMGKVFKAYDAGGKRMVALKVLNTEVLKDVENSRRLTAEGHLLSSFEHPNIVRVFETGESDGRGFIAMELLSGGTLRDRVERERQLPLQEIKAIIAQVCDALQVVHGRDIIHRDLKSGNVMFDADGKVRLMDFGLSRSPLVTTMTTLGTVLGTLGYVAPEQVTGLNVDRRTDIFSLGVILYELLTGELPFKGENEIALIHAIFNSVPPNPSALRPGLPAAWDAIVLQCIAREPYARPADAGAVKAMLEDL